MTTKLPSYPANHPVAIALLSLAMVLRTGTELIDALAESARNAGVIPFSDEFDKAAAMAGVPYYRALDLYVDRDTKRRADELGFGQAHLALCSS